VKTKIQLKNDDEIIKLAAEKASASLKSESKDTKGKPAKKTTIGTTEVIQSLIEVRGPFSLFQSADITLLTSGNAMCTSSLMLYLKAIRLNRVLFCISLVVFGIFGFGATELFRRSFSSIFFNEDAGGSEFVLLAAAGFATLLTCAAGAPFEILRVRSMSNVDAKGVKEVFSNLVVSLQL